MVANWKNFEMVTRLLFILFILVWAQSTAAEQQLTRVGYARSIENDRLLYTEYHHEVVSDDTVVESKVIYKDETGTAFAEKHVNFRMNPYLPEFSLINTVSGHRESTQYVGDKYEVQFLERAGESLREKPMEYPLDGIGDAGFDNFIINHWDDIVSGSKFTRDFLIPGMLRFFKFRIYQQKIVEYSDHKLRILHIEPANFLLRSVAGTSKLYYDFDKPVLRKFEGISNMRDRKGDNYRVIISYL
ncbi:MAG: hypothetical protein ACI909_000546 [Planctomycetota bacterium]